MFDSSSPALMVWQLSSLLTSKDPTVLWNQLIPEPKPDAQPGYYESAISGGIGRRWGGPPPQGVSAGNGRSHYGFHL